jgi:hypothetical protein
VAFSTDSSVDDYSDTGGMPHVGNDYQCTNGCGFMGLYHVVAKHELTCKLASSSL